VASGRPGLPFQRPGAPRLRGLRPVPGWVSPAGLSRRPRRPVVVPEDGAPPTTGRRIGEGGGGGL